MLETASATSCNTNLVESLARFNAKPSPSPQANTPIKLPVATALIGLSTTLNARVVKTSPKPCGGFAVAPAKSRVSCVGNKKLNATATNAALRVPTR